MAGLFNSELWYTEKLKATEYTVFYVILYSLLEEGGDWDRRNRLKVYRGLYALAIRDFRTAAISFLDTISTFTSYELMDYKQFVTYTVVASIISLERVDLKNKVMKLEVNIIRCIILEILIRILT